MPVVRTWKRDRSKNMMTLDMGAENLKSHCVDPKVREMTISTIRDGLLRGQRFETPLASFELVLLGMAR